MNRLLKTSVAVGICVLTVMGVVVGARAATITNYYADPFSTHALGSGAIFTVAGEEYSQNFADYDVHYLLYAGNGNNLAFKFDRQAGDTSAYAVTLNVAGSFEKKGGTGNSLVLWMGGDAYGVNDTAAAQANGYFNGDSGNLTTLASQTTDGAFAWDNVTFNILAAQQSCYILVAYQGPTVGGVSGHVYSLDADFTAIPEPASLALLGMGALALPRRRR
jgi:hypothetical protein